MNPPDDAWAEKKAVVEQYLNDPRTTGGRDRLWNHVRQQYPEISRRDVAKVLKDDPMHQIHKPLKRRVTTRPIVVSDRAKVAQIDLVDMQKIAGHNDGRRYFLSYVDLLSKYCAARAITQKTQANVTAALFDILDSMPASWRPSTIQADNGSEFQAGMQRALSQRGIKLIHSQPYQPRSQGAVERLNKSLKQPIFNLMAREGTKRWIDFLQPLIENLNSSKHESTGYTPLDLMQRPELGEELIQEIHERMERRRPKQAEAIHHEFQQGDYVRVALTSESAIRKQTFRKKIMANWSADVFQVYSVSEPAASGTQQQYLLKNLTTNRKSKKRYWGYQLQLVAEPAASKDDEQENDHFPDDNTPPDEPEEEVEEEIQAPVRRSARDWAPSAQQLRNLAQ